VNPDVPAASGLPYAWGTVRKLCKESAVFWYALFVLGYAVAAIGAGVILYQPVTTVMGTSTESRHRDTEEDEIWRDLLVTVGVAALWPVTFTLYLASRVAARPVG
jgi:hypothetical protein